MAKKAKWHYEGVNYVRSKNLRRWTLTLRRTTLTRSGLRSPTSELPTSRTSLRSWRGNIEQVARWLQSTPPLVLLRRPSLLEAVGFRKEKQNGNAQ